MHQRVNILGTKVSSISSADLLVAFLAKHKANQEALIRRVTLRRAQLLEIGSQNIVKGIGLRAALDVLINAIAVTQAKERLQDAVNTLQRSMYELELYI